MLSINNFLNKEEVSIINKRLINNDYFPWYHMKESSSDAYPFYGHILMRRGGEIASEWFEFFYPILNRFVTENLKIDEYEIIRGCINDSLSHDDKACDPHVDFEEDHIVIIMYLTNSTGNTNIYKQQWETGKPATYLNSEGNDNFTIASTIAPKQGKILGFNGLNYHSIDFKKCTDRRIITIFAIKEK